MNQQFKKSPKLEKWLRWMKDIENEISYLLGDVETFHRVRSIVKVNPLIQKPHRFYRYLFDSYISHAIIGLRRQIKCDKDSVSFVNLLEEIAKTPEELSRVFYRSLCSNPDGPDINQLEMEGAKGLAQAGITKAVQESDMLGMDDFAQYADTSGTHVCPQMVIDDIDQLRKTTIACEEYADKRIAHQDKRQPKLIKTYEELEEQLNNGLELLDKTYVKYHLLFHAEGMSTVKPTYQGDWKAIFSEPWMRDVTGSAK